MLRNAEVGTSTYSITFGDKNTWTDWHLVPLQRPVFSPPKTKQKYIDLPGGDGKIDLTDYLTGSPVYENSEGSFEFIVLNGWEDWTINYSNIANYLHGQRMRAILSHEPKYYYEGRFTLESWESEEARSIVTIGYNVDPIKKEV